MLLVGFSVEPPCGPSGYEQLVLKHCSASSFLQQLEVRGLWHFLLRQIPRYDNSTISRVNVGGFDCGCGYEQL